MFRLHVAKMTYIVRIPYYCFYVEFLKTVDLLGRRQTLFIACFCRTSKKNINLYKG